MRGLLESEAVLTQELSVRVINVSIGGCLVESRRWIEVGTIGTLRVRLGTEECTDDVEVVRCDAVKGAQTVYHVGVRLLKTRPRRAGSIRHAVARCVISLERRQTDRVM